jgi:hypothetical protein
MPGLLPRLFLILLQNAERNRLALFALGWHLHAPVKEYADQLLRGECLLMSLA